MILIANGWEGTNTYDNLDRVTEVKASKDGTSYTIGRYIYDKLGRVARFVDGQVFGKSCTYGYDLTDRLCEAVFDDGTAYRYTYDANDCLVKEVQTTPDGVRTVTRGYDADSRETSVACGSAKVEKTFDKLGRLSSIRRNGGKHTTTYIYETAADGGQTGRIKTVKNGSGQLMAIRYKGADYYYIRDGLMTITGLVDANGTAVVNYFYDSWGRMLNITGSLAASLGKDNPYRFKRYYYDEETGMYYLKRRYYQPEICRFVSADNEDVLIDTHVDLANKNLYLYCDNNPILKADEEGQIADWLVSAALGAAVNVAASFIIAQAMGQDFGVEDVAAAAVFGAVGGIFGGYSNWKKYIGAAANGIFMGMITYRSGASLGASLVSGGVAALFSASGIGDLAGLELVKDGHIVAGNVAATGSIDLVVNTGYTGMASAVSAAASANHKKGNTASSKSTHSKKGSYMNSMKPRMVSEQIIRKGGHVYRVRKYLYHGRLYIEWDIIR